MPREIRRIAVETAVIAPGHSEQLAALHLLPEDLLVLIIEECINIYFFPTSPLETLKQLRLTHRRLAYNRFLNTKLFSTLILGTTGPKEALPGIAPYVRKIVLQHEQNRTPDGLLLAPKLSPSAKNNLLSAFVLLPNVEELRIQGACMDADFLNHPPVDQMFKIAFSGLERSKAKLQSLCIEGHSSTQFASSSRLQEFHSLDLTSLRKLRIDPRYTLGTLRVVATTVFRNTDMSNYPGREVDLGLAELLRKCAQGLQELSIRCNAFFLGQSWNETPPTRLPALSTLLIEAGLINLSQVIPWLAQCASLTKLVLKRLGLDHETKISDWRSLFELLRNGSSDTDFELDVDFVLSFRGLAMTLTYTRADHVKSSQEQDDSDYEQSHIGKQLQYYISSRRGWITEQEEKEELDRLEREYDELYYSDV